MTEGLEQLRLAVEAELDLCFSAISGEGLQSLAEAIRYSLLAPGKRIRPVLALAAAEAWGGNPDDAIDVSVAFELIHAYSLVHDDLPCMDDDDLRRGMPTNHKVYGEGVAVLVGDALQAEAFRLVAATVGVPADRRLAIVELLARAAGWRGMVGGQYLDIQDGDARTLDELRDIHGRKTGALIAAAVEAGAIVGGADAAGCAAAREFGEELGWLFQLVDDLLDEVGVVAATGKAAGSDRRAGKVTGVDLFGGEDELRAALDTQLERCLEHAAALPNGGGQLTEIARYVATRDR